MASDFCPDALVQWWNAESMVVLCPYCKKPHRHGFPSGKDGRIEYDAIRRRGDCDQQIGGGVYVVVFPFDVARNVDGYEIDKDKGIFVSANLQVGQADGTISGYTGSGSLNDNMLSTETRPIPQERPQFSDATIIPVTMEYLGNHITFNRCFVQEALSACFCGDVRKVEGYLNELRDTDDYRIFFMVKTITGTQRYVLPPWGRHIRWSICCFGTTVT
ncbi:unnamed protein product [Phytophthora lilii]|uniref:Unnamed protein product n=1 Tax=Phytophthora lilii TaxID=2077276 RepID=A0A9W7CJ10_9STRA|nr:unnamed protein product [Phytophthora lilii]